MELFIMFLLGLSIGSLVSIYVCRSFKGMDKIELEVLKLENERLKLDLEHYKAVVEQESQCSCFTEQQRIC